MRLVLAGGPRTGKTTRATELGGGIKVLHTDDLIGKLDWSDASAEVATWFSRPGPWVIEGVACARSLRKWLAANRIGKPCDTVIHLRRPLVARTTQQEAMAKGCDRVWDEISAELARRGVRVQLG